MAEDLSLRTNFKDKVTLMDGIAILFIVFYHTLGHNLSTIGATFLTPYLRVLGLTTFVFSAGLKLGFNHFGKLNNKDFLGAYFTKRFTRLYKFYLGYTILIFVPVYFEMYIAKYYFKSTYSGVDLYWNNLNFHGIVNLLLGHNFVSTHLWFLPFLIVVTAICFTVIYFFNINSLLAVGIIFFIYDLIYWNSIDASFYDPYYLWNTAVKYIPIYILGIFFAGFIGHKSHKKCQLIFSCLFVIFFILSLMFPANYIFNYNLLIYGTTFPFFLFSLSSSLLATKYLGGFLNFCGNHSTEIYLFHVPLTLHILNESIINVANIDYFFIPYAIALLTIFTSVFIYNSTKKIKLNRLFE